jgi:ferredoxin
MKLRIDETLCTGHGRCWTLAPDVYDADDEGYNAARGHVIEVPQANEDQARLGMRACPEAAIKPVEEDG